MPEFLSSGATVIFVITIALSLLGLFQAPAIIERCAMRPYHVARGRLTETLITSGFVHADMGHLLFNMVTFYFFAFQLEYFIGVGRFVVLYAVGLVLSSLCSLFKHRNNAQYATIGASGAISAVLFAFIVYFPDATLYFLLLPVPIPAYLFAIGYVAYSFWAGARERGRINHDAHLCGAFTGLGFVLVTDPGAFTDLLSRLQ